MRGDAERGRLDSVGRPQPHQNKQAIKHTKHTPESWRKTVGPVYGNRTIKKIESDAGQFGTVVAEREVYVDGDEYDQRLDRIVACVNALAGIEDPAAFVAEASRIKAQRDELLAVAERWQKWFNGPVEPIAVRLELHRATNSAITNATKP